LYCDAARPQSSGYRYHLFINTPDYGNESERVKAKTITHVNELQKEFPDNAKEAFSWCERGFPAVRERLFGNAKEALLQTIIHQYITRTQDRQQRKDVLISDVNTVMVGIMPFHG